MMTDDIQKFSSHLAAIYSNLAKPTLDVILYNYQLAQNVGAEGLILLTVLVQASATLCECLHVDVEVILNLIHLVRALTPAFGAYAAQSAQLAGDFRHAHARLAVSAEEVAFLRGEEAEKLAVERAHAAVVLHEERVLRKRWWHACAEEGIVKWLWGSFGVSSCHVIHFWQ
jgi:ATP-binding cassette subfamily D (ALD) long-chain fatty acid import protein